MHGGSASAGSEDGQTGEGEVPQHFFLDASIEEIDNSTAHQQDIEVRAKQSEAQLLTAEVGIMGADLEKLSPAVRSYYIMMQHQILVRRGVITPENNDEA
ncbi:hypothetical protein EJB05_16161, partial [Eragrostis curvula]